MEKEFLEAENSVFLRADQKKQWFYN